MTSYYYYNLIILLTHQGSPRILEQVDYPFSRGTSWPRNQTRISCIAGEFFTSWTTREAQGNSYLPSPVRPLPFHCSSEHWSEIFSPLDPRYILIWHQVKNHETGITATISFNNGIAGVFPGSLVGNWFFPLSLFLSLCFGHMAWLARP